MSITEIIISSCFFKLTSLDVYETLCSQQMIEHKGGRINNEQWITGVGNAEISRLQLTESEDQGRGNQGQGVSWEGQGRSSRMRSKDRG